MLEIRKTVAGYGGRLRIASPSRRQPQIYSAPPHRPHEYVEKLIEGSPIALPRTKVSAPSRSCHTSHLEPAVVEPVSSSKLGLCVFAIINGWRERALQCLRNSEQDSSAFEFI